MSGRDPIELVLSRLREVEPNSNGGTGECPVAGCPYRLRVSRGDDGRALLACPAGHGAEDIVVLIDLTMRDLFVANGRERGREVIPPRIAPQPRNTPG